MGIHDEAVMELERRERELVVKTLTEMLQVIKRREDEEKENGKAMHNLWEEYNKLVALADMDVHAAWMRCKMMEGSRTNTTAYRMT